MANFLVQWSRHVMYQVMHGWHRRKKPLALVIALALCVFLLAQYSNSSANDLTKTKPRPEHIHSIVDLRNDGSDKQYGIFERVPKNFEGLQNNNFPRPQANDQRQGLQSGDRFIPSMRLVHLDMKGAPPKISYLKQIFPLLSQAGATGILLEYEDMFPYWDKLKTAVAGNAYSRQDVATIQNVAKANNLEVIPLVQTFGHLEMFIKLQEFRELREVDDFPQAICPSKNESFDLVTEIIDQMMALHPTVKWLHIGCDEVFHLGYCDKCRYKDRESLFLDHVKKVAKYVRDKHNVIPIIWDDMLRQIPAEKIKQMQLGQLGVEIMIWTYIKDIYRFIPYSQWLSFGELFDNIWGASAFKGAFGETLTAPNVKWHLENNEAWLQTFAEQKKYIKTIRGLVLTGWQRYDHFATLCELLPAAMPSLIINLLTVSHGEFKSEAIFKDFDRIMGCNSNNHNSYYNSKLDVDMISDPYLFSRTANCFFPGSAVYRMIQHHTDAIKRVNDYLYDVTVHKAWLTEYNVRHNMSSPYRVDEGLQEFSSVYYSIRSVFKTAQEALKEVYDDFTTSEWIEQNIYPYIMKLEHLMQNANSMKKAKTWPRRPLPPLDDLKRIAGDSNYYNVYGR